MAQQQDPQQGQQQPAGKQAGQTGQVGQTSKADMSGAGKSSSKEESSRKQFQADTETDESSDFATEGDRDLADKESVKSDSMNKSSRH